MVGDKGFEPIRHKTTWFEQAASANSSQSPFSNNPDFSSNLGAQEET